MVLFRQASGPQASRIQQARKHLRSAKSALTDTQSITSEQHHLFLARQLQPCIQQTTTFTDLSAELRNRIYEYAFSHNDTDNALIVASPAFDEGMTLAMQPAITMLSKQIRAESLAMFYAQSNFVAYIRDFDFSELFQWVRCITSAPTAPRVRVHVKLLDWVRCEYQLLRLMRAWRDLKHETVHIEVHNCFDAPEVWPHLRLANPMSFPIPPPTYDQRKLLVEAVREAEQLKARHDFTELKLREVCANLVGRIARYLPGCDAISVYGPGCRKHGYSARREVRPMRGRRS